MKKSQLRSKISKITGTPMDSIDVLLHKINQDYWGVVVMAPVDIGGQLGLLHTEEEAWGVKQSDAVENCHQIILDQIQADVDAFRNGKGHVLDLSTGDFHTLDGETIDQPLIEDHHENPPATNSPDTTT